MVNFRVIRKNVISAVGLDYNKPNMLSAAVQQACRSHDFEQQAKQTGYSCLINLECNKNNEIELSADKFH